MKAVDKAGGYVYGVEEGASSLASLLSVSVGADLDFFKYPDIACDWGWGIGGVIAMNL